MLNMRQRWLHITMLLWAVWWFGLFLPAHQRGQITVPGAQESLVKTACAGACPPQPDTGPACHTAGDPDPDHEAGRSHHPEEQGPCDHEHEDDDPTRQCAVCHLVAKLPTPAPPDLTVPPLGPLHAQAPHAARSLVSLPCAPVYFGRAPPPLG